jgi:23S rRNA (cytidine2498-2'-O)-methyltransferase
MIASAYLAAEGFEHTLAEELTRAGTTVSGWHGRLALSPDPPRHSAWAMDVWTAPVEFPAPSVKAAADALRAIQRNWAGYAAGHHRRSALIAERLPPVRARPLQFPEPAPTSHLGAWTLLDADRLLASPTKTSPFPNGEVAFVEDRTGPPSRAYLKLWEACTRLGAWPQPGEPCVDLGASPGGWTWAIAQLGASVLAIDRAPLDPAVAGLPGVRWQEGSAFTVEPFAVDWLFSDVIAYPAPLLEMVQRWMGFAGRIVCTVKLQGETDHDAIDAFAALGGRLMHLHHNKHELTFTWSAHSSPPALEGGGRGEGRPRHR